MTRAAMVAALLFCATGVGASGEGVPPPDRAKLRAAYPNRKSEAAVDAALAWLAKHQDDDGKWDSREFMKHDPPGGKCDGAGKTQFGVGCTGLALLTFLGAGYTGANEPYATTVARAIGFLRSSQDNEGCFGTRETQHFLYNHAIATWAIAEACWLTGREELRANAKAAAKFLEAARNPKLAWRYRIRGGENDTSLTGWSALALRVCAFAGVEVDDESFAGALRWIDLMTHRESGWVGYSMQGGQSARPAGLQDAFPADRTRAMTSIAVFVELALGGRSDNCVFLPAGITAIQERLPQWTRDGAIDMYYWYWGSLAMKEVGGKPWTRWESSLTNAALAGQCKNGAEAGSWRPYDPWGADGGRVYATTMMTLALESAYRYEGVFPKPPPKKGKG